uniref:MATH domain-containing protein n=2 Tax=Araneus ventricosus TaxID=182803 RepID=A0A4Y2K6G6_ARAVE|nr:hypothetical protein AVEN_82633-1 [Araneus ventricosus]
MSDNTFEVKWRIENAIPWFETRNDTLYSPPLLYEKARWKLGLTPNWQLAEKYISLTLHRYAQADDSMQISLSYKLMFLACDGSILNSKSGSEDFVLTTVRDGLNVRQGEILEEKRDAYLSEGVLTVGCKFWGIYAAPEEKYLLRSIIGTKCINLNATIANFIPRSIVAVNFMPPSADISLISLDIYVGPGEFIFKRKRVECEIFSWCSFQLFALGSGGEKTSFEERTDLTKHSTTTTPFQPMPINELYLCYLQNGTLRLQLEIVYYPGVVSENTETSYPERRSVRSCLEHSEDDPFM